MRTIDRVLDPATTRQYCAGRPVVVFLPSPANPEVVDTFQVECVLDGALRVRRLSDGEVQDLIDTYGLE